MATLNKRIIGMMLTVALILLVPFIAMQFTDEVNWNLSDFIVAGTLLLGAGFACELVIRIVKNTAYRLSLCVMLLVILILTWLELAVGILGTRFAGS